LTNAQSKIAPYAFTTVSVIPGMMEYKNARIQILDVPGLIQGAEEGKGRGREVLSVVRGSDLLVIISEPSKTTAFDSITKALEHNGIRLNKTRPDIRIDKKMGGGIIVHSNLRQDYSTKTIKEVAQEFGVKNAEITLKERVNFEELMDAFSKNRVYVPAIYVANKSDLLDTEHKEKISSQFKESFMFISAETKDGIASLKEEFWKKLNLVSIYLVSKNEEPNTNHPMILKIGTTLKQIAEKIGADFAFSKSNAMIWGPGSKFSGQQVSLSTRAIEGMMIKFI